MRSENERRTESKKKEKDTKPERLYKYGTKQIKEHIYIYGNLGKNVVVSFTESKFEDTKQKFDIDLPLVPKKTEDEEKSEPIRK